MSNWETSYTLSLADAREHIGQRAFLGLRVEVGNESQVLQSRTTNYVRKNLAQHIKSYKNPVLRAHFEIVEGHYQDDSTYDASHCDSETFDSESHSKSGSCTDEHSGSRGDHSGSVSRFGCTSSGASGSGLRSHHSHSETCSKSKTERSHKDWSGSNRSGHSKSKRSGYSQSDHSDRSHHDQSKSGHSDQSKSGSRTDNQSGHSDRSHHDQSKSGCCDDCAKGGRGNACNNYGCVYRRYDPEIFPVAPVIPAVVQQPLFL